MSAEVSRFNRIGVVGLGAMGAGIAEVFARSGRSVVGVEVDEAALERGRGNLANSTGRAVARGKLTEAGQAELLGRLTLTTDFAAVADCDLVIEAVPERLNLKTDLFARLDPIVRPDAVLATNTSALSVTSIAAATAHPDRVIGIHFFNPATVQPLVEVIRTVMTREHLADEVRDLVAELGKKPVLVTDRAGFVTNALLLAYLNRAIGMLADGHVSREDLDLAMTAGAGLPMGPLTLLDLVGNDVTLPVLETMHEQSGDPMHAPVPLLRQLITAGRLGRKSGQGFYTYAKVGSGEVVPDALTPSGSAGSEGGSGAAAVQPVGPIAVTGDDAAAIALRAALTEAGLVVHDELDPSAANGPVRAVGVLGADGASVALVELRRRYGQDPAALAAARAAVEAAGLPVIVCSDRAGGVVDALILPYLNDAIAMHASGYASTGDIDTAMRAGCGYPQGPFEVLGSIGLPTALAKLREIHAETPQAGLTPAPLLVQLVTAGRGFER